MKKKTCLASPHLPPNENNKSQLILYICFSYHSKNVHKCSVLKKIQKDGCINEEFHSQKVKNKNTYFRVASGLWKFLVAIGHECDDLQYTKSHTALACRKLTFSAMIGCHKPEFTHVVCSCIQVMENIGKRDFSVAIWFFV